MKRKKRLHGWFHYFTMGEKILWAGSVLAILIAFFLFGGTGFLTLSASLVGVTALILNAKGNPIGQLLIIIFSLIYGYLSFTFSYFGEMITYLGMSMPMAAIAMISWMKNPYKGNKSEVKVNRLPGKEWGVALLFTAIVTFVFYFILKHFDTANLIPSTLSVATSFLAVYLTFRRSPFFAIGYALNDMVLIVLWLLATFENKSYLSVVVCFVTFLVNDLYGFVNWLRIEKRQAENA